MSIMATLYTLSLLNKYAKYYFKLLKNHFSYIILSINITFLDLILMSLEFWVSIIFSDGEPKIGLSQVCP